MTKDNDKLAQAGVIVTATGELLIDVSVQMAEYSAGNLHKDKLIAYMRAKEKVVNIYHAATTARSQRKT